jgi:hypothetical protein
MNWLLITAGALRVLKTHWSTVGKLLFTWEAIVYLGNYLHRKLLITAGALRVLKTHWGIIKRTHSIENTFYRGCLAHLEDPLEHHEA